MTQPIVLVVVNFVFLFVSALMDIVDYYTDMDVAIIGDVLWKLAAMLGPTSILLTQL